MSPAEPVSRPAAERAAAAALAQPGVAALHPGEFNEVALLYPGGRVRGLRLESSGPLPRLQVHLVVDLPRAGDLRTLSETVRAAVGAHVPLPVDVVLADAIASDSPPQEK